MEPLQVVDWSFFFRLWSCFFALGFFAWIVAHCGVRFLISKFVPWNL